jgi:hypothetical protein
MGLPPDIFAYDGFVDPVDGTVLVLEQDFYFALENVISSHTFAPLEALPFVWLRCSSMLLGRQL